MPARILTDSRRPLLALLLPCALAATQARAIVINEGAFTRLGGDLANLETTSARVDQQLLKESVKPRFHSAGLLKLFSVSAEPGCEQTNATWLGEDEAYVYLLAGAVCLSGRDVNAQTRLAQVEFIDWREKSVISGEARIFFPGYGKADRMALVRMPRPADKPLDILKPLLPPVRISDTYRYSDGQTNQAHRSMEGVGYGLGGVGSQANTARARRFGLAVRQDDGAHSIHDNPHDSLLLYDAKTDADRWARAAKGDNGSGWYERGASEVMLTDVTNGYGKDRTATERVASHARWIEGIFPGVRIARRTRHVFDGSWADAYPLTERRPLVTTDFSLDGLSGERRHGVYFKVPSEPQAGPMRSGAPGHTRFEVAVKDEQSGVATRLSLRGQKMTPCAGLLAMNDPTGCEQGEDGRLMLSYWPEDNPGLAPGRVFIGTFDISGLFGCPPASPADPTCINLLNPDVFRVDVRIATRALGRVTAKAPFEWDYKGAVHRRGILPAGEEKRPNRFTFSVPAQDGVMQAVEVSTTPKSKQPDRLIAVVVHDLLGQKTEWVHDGPNSFGRHMPRTTRVIQLRAQMGQGCGEAKPCAPQDRKRRLTVAFVKEDNPDLPPGIYRGRFDMDGSHISGAGTEQNRLSVDVDLDTL